MTEDPPSAAPPAPPAPHRLPRWLALRLLGLTLAAAFISLWSQLPGLIGAEGILPAADTLDALARWAERESRARWAVAPTLGWWWSGDTALNVYCAAGALSGLAVVAGLAPRLTLALAWALYLTLFHLAGPFLGYQWDILLLEATLVAIVYAPPGWRTRLATEPPPPRAATWLLRALVFKLMFSSGVAKPVGGDPTWKDLSALDYHFWTQPLPHLGAWWAHHAGDWTRQLGVVAMYVAEVFAPLLILVNPRRERLLLVGLAAAASLWMTGGVPTLGHTAALLVLAALLDDRALARALPRLGARFTTEWLARRDIRPRGTESRHAAFWPMAGLLLAISASGNYGFFQLLTLALCCALLDDAAVIALVPRRWRARLPIGAPLTAPPPPPSRLHRRIAAVALAAALALHTLTMTTALIGRRTLREAQHAARAGQATAAQTALATLVDLRAALLDPLRPLHSMNGYGLFVRMTTDRPELTLEGSNDGQTWQAYRFHYKIDAPEAMSALAGLHMPRLDWQMWFAALSPRCGNNGWLFQLFDALFAGRAPVRALFAEAPFEDAPPRFLRVRRTLYTLSDPEGHRRTGRRWRTEETGLYCPPLTREQVAQVLGRR